jgi:hypothetical protein
MRTWFSSVVLTTDACFDYLLGVRLGGQLVKTMPKGFGRKGSGGGMMATIADMDFS